MSDYARPATLSQALSLLDAGPWRVLAGGSDLYPGAASALSGPVLDLAALEEFSEVRQDTAGLRIGAFVTWAALAEAQLPPGLRALQQAARQIGGRQIQNVATIGGNLCNASPAADGVPPLLAVDAEVELLSQAGQRRLPLSEFLIGPRKTALRRGEVLAAIHVPAAALSGQSAFVKLGARAHLVISIAMVAARLTVSGGAIRDAAIAVGACSPVAVRLSQLEREMVGAPIVGAAGRIDPDLVTKALSPIDDVRATAAYRKAAAADLVRRAVAECAA